MTSIFVYDISTLIISILGTYGNGLAVDYFIDGFNKRKRVCIICDDYKDIQDYILNDLKRGVTLYTAQGAYDERASHRTGYYSCKTGISSAFKLSAHCSKTSICNSFYSK